jgi:Molecular chaperone (small heat shock protein)
MSLIPWHDPFEEVEQIMKDLHPSTLGGNASFIPSVNIYETDKAVVVESAVPGVDVKDVEISIENDILTIKGQTKKSSELDEKDFYRKEIREGSFLRRVGMPAPVLGEQAEAEFKDGLLKITVPKAGSPKGKAIKINIKN